MKTKTYISGRISGLAKDKYKPIFEDAFMKVFRRKEEPKAPIYFKHFRDSKKGFFYLMKSVNVLLSCNKILMLPNWKQCKFSKVEWCIAKIFRIQIDYDTDN